MKPVPGRGKEQTVDTTKCGQGHKDGNDPGHHTKQLVPKCLKYSSAHSINTYPSPILKSVREFFFFSKSNSLHETMSVHTNKQQQKS